MPATKLEIRPLHRDDLPELLQLERDSFSDAWPRSAFESEIGSEAPPLVAMAAGRVVGYICRMLGPGELHITNIAVAEAFRRHKVASRLLRATIRLAAQKRCKWIYLDVRPSNQAARGLYERFGFVEIFRRRKYYIKPHEDGLVLARPIRPRDGDADSDEADHSNPQRNRHGLV